MLKRGNPGNKGGGRKPDAFKAQMAELLNTPKADKFLRDCLEGKHGADAYIKARKYCTEYAYGKPQQEVKHQGDAKKPLRVLITKE